MIVSEQWEGLQDFIEDARNCRFDKFLYTIDSFTPDRPEPMLVIGEGWPPGYLQDWMKRVREDPLRRMVIRGEVPISTIPVVYENSGRDLKLHCQHNYSVQECSLLHWVLSVGVRTGVSAAIPMSTGLYATFNFYSADRHSAMQSNVERLFLLGHRIHELIGKRIVHARFGSAYRTLSRREQECLELLAAGKETRAIGAIMGISPETAKEYIANLLRKLGAANRAEAVYRACKYGYLQH